MTGKKAGFIRWWGLGVFLILLAFLVLVWLLMVDRWVKATIEEEGTSAVGAKVEVGSADLTLFPLGLTLERLQITNPEKPMTNIAEIEKLAMDLDGLELLRRKVVINEMIAEGVRLNTARTTSGAIDDRAKKQQEGRKEEEVEFSLPPFEVPDVRQILEQENLETLRLIRAIQTDIQREQEVWKKRLKELPGKEAIEKYRKRLKALKGATKGGIGEVLGGVDEIKALRQEIEQDIANLRSAREEFDEKVALLRRRMVEVKTAPQRDVQRLREKYSLSPQGLANLGQTLLGKQVGEKLKELAYYYGMVRSYLEGLAFKESATPDEPAIVRGKGQDIHFAEYEPLPDFLVRIAKVSLHLDVGEIRGTLQHITSDQTVLGKPLSYAFSGTKLKNMQNVTIEGLLDHRAVANPHDTLNVQINGYELKSLALSTQPEWPVTIEKGMADINVSAALEGQHLQAKGKAFLSSMHVSAGRTGDTNPLTQTLSKALSEITSLSVEVNVAGTLDNYTVHVRSELDSLFKNAAGKIVSRLSSEFSQKLQTALSAKIADPLKSLKRTLNGFQTIGGELIGRLTNQHALLKELLKHGLPQKVLPKDLSDKLPGGLKLPF